MGKGRMTYVVETVYDVKVYMTVGKDLRNDTIQVKKSSRT